MPFPCKGSEHNKSGKVQVSLGIDATSIITTKSKFQGIRVIICRQHAVFQALPPAELAWGFTTLVYKRPNRLHTIIALSLE